MGNKIKATINEEYIQAIRERDQATRDRLERKEKVQGQGKLETQVAGMLGYLEGSLKTVKQNLDGKSMYSDESADPTSIANNIIQELGKAKKQIDDMSCGKEEKDKLKEKLYEMVMKEIDTFTLKSSISIFFENFLDELRAALSKFMGNEEEPTKRQALLENIEVIRGGLKDCKSTRSSEGIVPGVSHSNNRGRGGSSLG